ncbi:MAG: hypothetical protein ACI9W2_001043 [Gammaproteobacteria bacterium]|jgi:hypothetical protein
MGKNVRGIVPVPTIARLARAVASRRIIALGAQKGVMREPESIMGAGHRGAVVK